MATCLVQGRLDVLVYSEEVGRVVLLLDGGQATVVVAVGGADALLALLHHEIEVGSLQIIWMDGFPVFLGPGLERWGIRRVTVNTTNDHRIGCVPAIPSGLVSP